MHGRADRAAKDPSRTSSWYEGPDHWESHIQHCIAGALGRDVSMYQKIFNSKVEAPMVTQESGFLSQKCNDPSQMVAQPFHIAQFKLSHPGWRTNQNHQTSINSVIHCLLISKSLTLPRIEFGAGPLGPLLSFKLPITFFRCWYQISWDQ